MRCGHGLGADFQQVLQTHDVETSPAGTKNLQANSVCERLHQSIGNSSCTLSSAQAPKNSAVTEDMINTALQTASCAAKSTIHSTMKLSPGAVCFGHDMTLEIPAITKFQLLQQCKEALIDKNLMRENRKRISHDCQMGDVVSELTFQPHKLESRRELMGNATLQESIAMAP